MDIGNWHCTAPFSVFVDIEPVSAEGGSVRLLGARPNPMRGQGEIRFVISEGRSRADVKIYDIVGRLVRDLGTHEVGAGTHAIPWDGLSKSGTVAGNGMYLVRLTTDNGEPAVAKLLVTR